MTPPISTRRADGTESPNLSVMLQVSNARTAAPKPGIVPTMPKLSRWFETRRGDDGVSRMTVHLTGVPLLRLAATNKGTAFTQEERSALGLHGLLPPRVTTIEEQVDRVYAQYQREQAPLSKYQFLRSLQERNETLFYAVVERYLAEVLPILYTPTVGDAVKEFHAIYQSAR